jgi:hypothetical protein
MDPYLRNKDWLYGLGRTGCANVGDALCRAAWLVASRLLVGLAWRGASTGAASPVLSGAGSFGSKQPP